MKKKDVAKLKAKDQEQVRGGMGVNPKTGYKTTGVNPKTGGKLED